MSPFADHRLQAAFCSMTAQFGLEDVASEAIEVIGDIETLGTPIRVQDAGTLTLALQATAISAIDIAEGRGGQSVTIRRDIVPPALRPFTYQTHNGQLSSAWTSQIGEAPCSGHMPTADGRHIYMANVVPRLRDATLKFLGAEPTRASVMSAVQEWQAFELERAMADVGLPLTVVRDENEWALSAQGKLMASQPLVHLRQVAEAPPMPLPSGARALSGLRVLDLTHVVAGPMVTRGLAEYGADVLHVGSVDPQLQDPVAVTDELMIGKRSILADLRSRRERDSIEDLMRNADVVVHSWRPGVMERWGWDVDRLQQLRPGIISLGISCYGPSGPWADRPGFDGNALAAVGVTTREAAETSMRLTPPGVLTDSLVGFAGVAAVASMLRDRAARGGGRAGHLSLARMAMWLLELGLQSPVSGEKPGDPAMRRSTSHDGGVLGFVAFPISYSDRPAELVLGRPDLGGSTAAWMPATAVSSL